MEGVTTLLERDELLAALAAAAEEGGRLVFVGGEAGVGKTALVRAFCSRPGLRVLRGSCENLATPTPLGPFVDIAAESGGGLASAIADARDPRLVARAVLAELSSRLVLVLEDLHWADEATLDALRVLGRRIDRASGLVIATYRDDEVESGHPLRIVLGELASAPGVSRLRVPPLSLDAVRELAGPYGADGDAIHELTGGNGFYVTEILAVGNTSLPETVRDAVLARAASLGAEARRLLDVVALVPGSAELALLEVVAPADSTSSTRASPPASSARTAMEWSSATSSRGSRSRAPSPQVGGDGCTRRSSGRCGTSLRKAETPRDSPTTRSGRERRIPCSSTRPPLRVRRPPRERIGRRHSSTRGRCGSPTGSMAAIARSCSTSTRSRRS